MSWTLDSVGPMARTAEDVAILLDAMDDQSIRPALCTEKLNDSVMGLRVGVPLDDFFWRETSHQVVGAVRGAIETFADLGIIPVDVRLLQMNDVLRAASVISMADAAAYHADRLANEPDRFGTDVRARLEWGQRRSAVDYAQARQTGREWQAAMQALFRDEIDVLALPTAPVTALPIEGNESLSAAKELLRFTYPFSLSGLPALSMPCGFSEDRLPIGVQLIATGEATLVRVAHAFQQKTNWHAIAPDL
jgi:aspartyl-tRNA(Asn)/glutamyl-tRNA(Gln) amidotransferase subunit A